jgi:DNA-binding winged helix-turn-helix (wHTH) protein/TolB-like protein/Tfp pilus assembly protein PilF
MSNQNSALYRFGPFLLDTMERQLTCDGEVISLTFKAFDTLVALVESSPHILTKDELLRRVWSETFVEENTLASNISTLRKALARHSSGSQCIETVPKIGYRFILPVQTVGTPQHGLQVDTLPEKDDVTREENPERIPEQTRAMWLRSGRTRKNVVVLAALLVVLAASSLYVVTSGMFKGRPARDGARSLAVLPLSDLGSDRDDAYLGIGIADTLITKISSLRQIVVRPTSSVRKFAAADRDPLAAGRELGVDSVLDGSFQQEGGRIRITVRLLDARTGSPIWAEKFDQQFTDIFALEDSISQKLAGALALRLTAADRKLLGKQYTQNPDAYQLYLKGRYHWNKWTPGEISKALDYFNQAIQGDSNFALAYAGLADSYDVLGVFGSLPPNQAWPMTETAAKKALELDDGLAEAHVSLAAAKMVYEWDWNGAESEFKRALDLDPEYSTAHQSYGLYLMAQGRSNESIAEMKKAQQLEPFSLIINTSLGWTLYFSRNYDQAITQFKNTVDLDPNYVFPRESLALVYDAMGRYQDASAQYLEVESITGGKERPRAGLAHSYAKMGRRADAVKLLDEIKRLSADRYVSPSAIAVVYEGLGDRDQTFEWLEHAYRERSNLLWLLKVNPAWDSLRADPRFQNLLARVGLM